MIDLEFKLVKISEVEWLSIVTTYILYINKVIKHGNYSVSSILMTYLRNYFPKTNVHKEKINTQTNLCMYYNKKAYPYGKSYKTNIKYIFTLFINLIKFIQPNLLQCYEVKLLVHHLIH